jgi:modulator of FtsH protease HflK
MNAHPDPAPSPTLGPPRSPEDSTSQALAEALRSSFTIIKLLMLALVLYFCCSGAFTVGPQERAMILRFGKPVGAQDQVLLGPGLHWAFPAPIDEVVRIPAGQVRLASSSAGWYFTTQEKALAQNEPPPGESLKPGVDGYVLTADANIIHAEAKLRYRIIDPVRFEFGFADAAQFITNALNEALNYAAARFPVDRIVTGEEGFRKNVRLRLEELIDQQRLGIVVEQTDVPTRPPRQPIVSNAFNAVADASQKTDLALKTALSYASEATNKALGEAASLTNAAIAETTRLVGAVNAEAERFKVLRPIYESNPQLYTLLWQAETLARVFTNAAEKVYIAPGPNDRPRELRLLIGREPEKSSAAPPPAPAKEEH